MPTWHRLVEPVSEGVTVAMTKAMDEQFERLKSEGLSGLGEGAGLPEGFPQIPGLEGLDLGGLIGQLQPALRQMAGSMFSAQLGTGVGALAADLLSATEVGLPLLDNEDVALLPANVAAFTEGLGVEAGEVRLYLAVREAARARLFAQVPWLGPQLEAAVRDYARNITIDTDAIEEQVRNMDLQNPAQIQESLRDKLFSPTPTAAQRAALGRLETSLALVEGWVDLVTEQATTGHLPHADALGEAVRRRRVSGPGAEDVQRAGRARAAPAPAQGRQEPLGGPGERRRRRVPRRAVGAPRHRPDRSRPRRPAGLRREAPRRPGAATTWTPPSTRCCGTTVATADSGPTRRGLTRLRDDPRPAARGRDPRPARIPAGRPAQEALRLEYLAFLADHPDGVWKAGPPEHLTASCLVLDEGLGRVLLTHHRKARHVVPVRRPPRAGGPVGPGGGRARGDGGVRDHGPPGDAGAGAPRPARALRGVRAVPRAPRHPVCGDRAGGGEPRVSGESLDVRWWPVDGAAARATRRSSTGSWRRRGAYCA